MNTQKCKCNIVWSHALSCPRHIFSIGICGLLLLCTFARSQFIHTFVTNTNAIDATAFNNSHKIALRNADPTNDTISIVYQDTDSVKYVMSLTRGLSWQTPVTLSPGQYPAIDIDTYGFRHIVWQRVDTLTSTTDIIYDCIDDYSPPVNISESAENSFFADVVVDDSICAHIVWVENTGPSNQIYYRTCHAGSLGPITQVSPSWPNATHTLPSISIFSPNNRIYVVWDGTDYDSYSPYQVLYRYKEGTSWSTTDYIYASYLDVGHSSIDFDHGQDQISCCFDYEAASGNMEASFFGGNWGGYATPGESTYPVMTTMGDVWSYLFWQEDSSGIEDIYFHLYYFVTGWIRGSIRTEFSINEPVRFPNSCGAYMVWTQGTTAPYKLYFADFGYPVGTAEYCTDNSVCFASPSPFRAETRISYSVGRSATDIEIGIYNIAGILVKCFPHITHDALRGTLVWDGTDNHGHQVPACTYFIVISTPYDCIAQKIIKLK